jgi:hypothetical protein
MSVLETSSGWVQSVTPSLKTSPEGISSGSSNFSILFSGKKKAFLLNHKKQRSGEALQVKKQTKTPVLN